ncbi:hypothetical protein R6Q59_028904 [Mikania micrantha]
MDPNQIPNQYYNPSTPPNRNPNTPPPNWFFNQSSPQQGFYTFIEYGSSQQTHEFAQLSQDKVVPETQPSTDAGPSTQLTQRRKHKKKTSWGYRTRCGSSNPDRKWTTEEEFALLKAWVDVSEDPIVGRNKKGPDFWSKIRSHFFQAMGRAEYRTNDMISSKWRDINRKVKRFNGNP